MWAYYIKDIRSTTRWAAASQFLWRLNTIKDIERTCDESKPTVKGTNRRCSRNAMFSRRGAQQKIDRTWNKLQSKFDNNFDQKNQNKDIEGRISAVSFEDLWVWKSKNRHF